MAVCQMMRQRGGWPLTVILTPDKIPFFAGTYFPKNSTKGSVGLCDFLPKVKIEIVSNIMNITYGRNVGYKIEQEHFDKSIENISSTKIRMAQEAIEGKYGI